MEDWFDTLNTFVESDYGEDGLEDDSGDDQEVIIWASSLAL